MMRTYPILEPTDSQPQHWQSPMQCFIWERIRIISCHKKCSMLHVWTWHSSWRQAWHEHITPLIKLHTTALHISYDSRCCCSLTCNYPSTISLCAQMTVMQLILISEPKAPHIHQKRFLYVHTIPSIRLIRLCLIPQFIIHLLSLVM